MVFLIVDDNSDARKIIREILGGKNNKIFECSDGQQAIELYKTYKPDWVLMNIKMQNIDGITATKKIIKEFPNAKVIIMTSYNNTYLKINAEKAGAKAFVLKDSLITLNSIIQRD